MLAYNMLRTKAGYWLLNTITKKVRTTVDKFQKLGRQNTVAI